jgi:hypothetical protein
MADSEAEGHRRGVETEQQLQFLRDRGGEFRATDVAACTARGVQNLVTGQRRTQRAPHRQPRQTRGGFARSCRQAEELDPPERKLNTPNSSESVANQIIAGS